MMRWILCVTAATLLLSGCNLYRQHEAESQVRDLLRDPESAQFSDFTVAGNGLLVCGKVNAKNGMGGYVGKRTFIVWANDGASIAGDEMDSIRFDTCCTLLESAVNMHRNSDQIEGFGRSCRGIAKNHFTW